LIGNQPTLALKIPGILNGFHEYAVDWSEQSFIFYIDKKEIVRFNKKDYIPKAEWPFDQPFYLILNLAIGGTWGGPIDDKIFPMTMQFQYVKVYERSV
jgi:beta-glucanase (GH16 family)